MAPVCRPDTLDFIFQVHNCRLKSCLLFLSISLSSLPLFGIGVLYGRTISDSVMPLLVILLIALTLGLSFKTVQRGMVARILIGTPILIIIGFLDPSNIGTVMLFGIVCTAGL